jgi:zinc transporter 1/2/3
MPKAALFVAKYFGTGVILATAWMHLLSPASDNLRDECLGDILPDYDWAMAIGLMTVMVMFLLELIISHFDFGFGSPKGHSHGASAPSAGMGTVEASGADVSGKERIHPLGDEFSYAPNGTDHLGHQRDHVEGDGYANYAAQITAIFVLEFGVIFHSIFIGLTLAVTDNFIILFVVLVFHQTFEGFGLGARLAMATWPKGGWTPYILGMLYAISTPLSIGMGLVANETLSLDAATSKVVNGVFDAISGGILMYTGLVELVAHEFMFSPEMRRAGLPTQLAAYACVATGVGLMALLAKWA